MFNSVADYFAQYQNTIILKDGHKVSGPIQYNITGDGGGNWYIEINGNTITVNVGIATNPISTVICSASDYLDLKNQKTTWSQLISSKKMIFTGSNRNILLFSNYFLK